MNVGQSFKFNSNLKELCNVGIFSEVVLIWNWPCCLAMIDLCKLPIQMSLVIYIYIYMERLQLVKCHNI